MAEEIKKDIQKDENGPKAEAAVVDTNKGAAQAVAKSVYGAKKFFGKKKQFDRPQEEFEQKIIDLARVTRVMAGGKRMRFRACVAIGDRKGRVSLGLAKGADVTVAVNKAVNQAKKNIITVPIVNETIPHAIVEKMGAAEIVFKPAGQGKGIVAGGVVRVVLDLAGIKNVTSKILGTNNKVNNAKCVIKAFEHLQKPVVKNEKIEKNNTTKK